MMFHVLRIKFSVTNVTHQMADATVLGQYEMYLILIYNFKNYKFCRANYKIMKLITGRQVT